MSKDKYSTMVLGRNKNDTAELLLALYDVKDHKSKQNDMVPIIDFRLIFLPENGIFHLENGIFHQYMNNCDKPLEITCKILNGYFKILPIVEN